MLTKLHCRGDDHNLRMIIHHHRLRWNNRLNRRRHISSAIQDRLEEQERRQLANSEGTLLLFVSKLR